MNFTKQKRQEIIDKYLFETGANHVVAQDFIAWVSKDPKNPAYHLFFGKDDSQMASEYRVSLARSFMSGLRVTVQVSVAPATARNVSFRTVEAPLMFSPISKRMDGGGYVPLNTKDPECMAEFRKEAANALASYVKRYGAALADAGIEAKSLTAVVEKLMAIELLEA